MLHITKYQSLGGRDEQEDRFTVIEKFAKLDYLTLCLVCDGHGGKQASTFLVQNYPVELEKLIVEHIQYHKKHDTQPKDKSESNAPKKSTLCILMEQALAKCVAIWGHMCYGDVYPTLKTKVEVEAYFNTKAKELKFEQEGKTAGSTLIAMLVNLRKSKAYVLNLGDSRATWKVENTGIMQTTDHNIPRKSKEERPGFDYVIKDGRLQGDLIMSRAFGDHQKNLTGRVRQDGDSYEFDFSKLTFRAVIASDGLFDILSNQQVLFEEFDDATEIAQRGFEVITEKACEEEEKTQLALGNTKFNVEKFRAKFKPVYPDNCTVIYIKLKQENTEPPQTTTEVDKLMRQMQNLEKNIQELKMANDTMKPKRTSSSVSRKTASSSHKRASSVSRRNNSKETPPPQKDTSAYQSRNVTMHFVRRKPSKTKAE